MIILNKFTYQIIFLLLYLTVNPTAFAQDKIDSLKTAVENENDLNKKAQLSLELSREYKSVDMDKSREYAEQALLFAKQAHNTRISGLVHAFLGDLDFLKDSLVDAEKEYTDAIPLLTESGEYHKLILVYLSLGNQFVEKGNYHEAMNYYLEGLSLSDKINDSTYLARLYNNMGVIYINLSDNQMALDYYLKALPLFKKLQDTMNIAGTTTNIGSIYLRMGDYKTAEKYYRNGYSLFKIIGLHAGEAHALFKLAQLNQQEGNHGNALKNLLRSLEIQQSDTAMPVMSKSMFLSETFVNLGAVYLHLDRDKQALHYLQKGLDLARKYQQIGIISMAAENLSKLYKKKKMYDKALSHFELFKKYSDSVFNEDNIRQLTQTEMKFRFDRKMKETEFRAALHDQQQKQRIWIAIAVSLALFLSLLIVVLLLKLEKNRKKKFKSEMIRLGRKLEQTNKELATYVLYLMKKNEFILTIIDKLKKARLGAKVENKKLLSELISELTSSTNMVSWEEFEVRFQEVYTGFYKNLRERHPDLTNNEVRLCAFFKLNMTTKEIAAITYQSLNSIKVARYRLRKKLDISKEENMIAFLSQF